MKVKQYSLLDYAISIKSSDIIGGSIDIPIGGRGSYLGSVTVSRNTANITSEVDATGSGVFSFSADNSGTLTFNLSYVSDTAMTIINSIVSKYRDPDTQAWKTAMVDIVISNAQGPVITAKSCMLQGSEDLNLSPEVPRRDFVFLAMDIDEVTRAI